MMSLPWTHARDLRECSSPPEPYESKNDAGPLLSQRIPNAVGRAMGVTLLSAAADELTNQLL